MLGRVQGGRRVIGATRLRRPPSRAGGVAHTGRLRRRAASPDAAVRNIGASRSENMIADMETELSEAADTERNEVVAAEAKLAELQHEIDAAYIQYFDVGDITLGDGSTRQLAGVTEREMQEMGRAEPAVCSFAGRCATAAYPALRA
jgi:hypothetical protein